MGMSALHIYRLQQIIKQNPPAQEKEPLQQMKTERTQVNNDVPGSAETLLANLDRIAEIKKNAFDTFS